MTSPLLWCSRDTRHLLTLNLNYPPVIKRDNSPPSQLTDHLAHCGWPVSPPGTCQPGARVTTHLPLSPPITTTKKKKKDRHLTYVKPKCNKSIYFIYSPYKPTCKVRTGRSRLLKAELTKAEEKRPGQWSTLRPHDYDEN